MGTDRCLVPLMIIVIGCALPRIVDSQQVLEISPQSDDADEILVPAIEEIDENSSALETGILDLVEQQADTDVAIARDEKKPARVSPVGLVEYKQTNLEPSGEIQDEENSTIKHRLETGGEEYDYAAASRGAKVVSSNKEAKGGGNVLIRDNDKYFRNPCNAEEKFVVLELSQETLVVTIAIANYELYSSNPKEFELLGSLVYPTEEWKLLGKFEAENVRQSQRFTLAKPAWAKYLKLRMLSHYGTEFYCTLSTIQVFGDDAIERMLEGWIGRGNTQGSGSGNVRVNGSSSNSTEENQNATSSQQPQEQPSAEASHRAAAVGDKAEGGTSQGGISNRATSGVVIKLLMEKVQQIEKEQNVFDKYLESSNVQYKAIFSEYDQEIANVNSQLQQLFKRNKLLTDTVLKQRQQLDELIAKSANETRLCKRQVARMEDRELVAFSVALLTVAVFILSKFHFGVGLAVMSCVMMVILTV